MVFTKAVIFEYSQYIYRVFNELMIKNLPRNLIPFKGFTLIELLIVIAILGILAAAVLVAINPGKRTSQARDAARKNDIGSLVTSTQAYYTTPGQGQYPGTQGCGTTGNGFTFLTGQDLKLVPDDPKPGWDYCYVVNAGSTEAAIYATLEAPNNTATDRWCWRSISGVTAEVTSGTCTAP